MEKRENLAKYFWRVTYSHAIAYWLAGALMMVFMNYDYLWSTEHIAAFYRPLTSPLIPLAPLLQIPRGILIALFILPLRNAFFIEKYGLLKLWLIVFGFAAVSTIGAVWSSFEGLIFLKLPFRIHLMGYPEILTYISLFVGILYLSKRFAHRKITTIMPIIMMLFIVFASIAGTMQAIK